MVIAATVLVAFADALINDSIGMLTGLALLVSSVYAAVVVRRADIWAAVVIPPLAFLAATLTAGQLTLDSSGSLLIREGYMLFRTLAVNAPWILGTTVVCLVIVLVRARAPLTTPLGVSAFAGGLEVAAQLRAAARRCRCSSADAHLLDVGPPALGQPVQHAAHEDLRAPRRRW